jgi:hypothetical protein
VADWADFYTMIAPHVPGAAEPAIEDAARSAAIELCSKSGVAEKTLADIPTVQDQADYTIAGATSEVIARLLSARLDGQRISVLTPADLDELPDLEGDASTWAAVLLTPSTVSLILAPAAAGRVLSLRAAMQPARAATTLDDAVFERYAEDIAWGAVARLVPKRLDAQARFLDAIGRAKAAVLRNHSRAGTRSRVNWC